MDTNLNTVTTTTNNLTAILPTIIPTDTKVMEYMVKAMVNNNMEAMVTNNSMDMVRSFHVKSFVEMSRFFCHSGYT